MFVILSYQMSVPAFVMSQKIVLLAMNLLHYAITLCSINMIILYLRSGPPAYKTVMHFIAVRSCQLMIFFNTYVLIFLVISIVLPTQLESLYNNHYTIFCSILPIQVTPYGVAYLIVLIHLQECH